MKSKLFKKELVVILGLTLVLGLFFQNCSQLGRDDEKSKTPSSQFSEQELMLQKSMLVLQSKCSTCHNNEIKTSGVNVTSLDEMLVVGVIVVNEPALSPLMLAIQNATVMEHGSLKQSEINTLSTWIAEGFKDGATGGTVDPGVILPLGPTYASLNQNIFSRRCTGCHNNVTLSGGVSFQTYAGVRSRVVPTNAAGSELFLRVTTQAPIMPLGGGQPLSQAERDAIRDWINAGAMQN